MTEEASPNTTKEPHTPLVANAFKERVHHPEDRPKIFWAINIVWFITMILTSLWAITGDRWTGDIELWANFNVPLGPTVLATQLAWLIGSIRMFDVTEVAVIVLYGLPMITVRRGPKLLIFGLFQSKTFEARVYNNQYPAEPELIQKTNDKEPLAVIQVTNSDGTVREERMVRPIRITTAKPKKQEGNSEFIEEVDILNSQMTVEFTFWVRWIVDDPLNLLINAGGDLDEVVKQMRDIGESLLNLEVTQLTPSELVSGFAELQRKLGKAITDQIGNWGISVLTVGLTAPDINHEVASALRDIVTAKAVARKTVIDSEAKATELANIGKGEGKAQEEKLAGEGRGYKRAAAFIGIDAEAMLQAQVARDTVGEADLVLGADGLAQALGIGKKLLEKKQPKEIKSDKEN